MSPEKIILLLTVIKQGSDLQNTLLSYLGLCLVVSIWVTFCESESNYPRHWPRLDSPRDSCMLSDSVNHTLSIRQSDRHLDISTNGDRFTTMLGASGLISLIWLGIY